MEKEKIVVLTYDAPHRKTQDLLFRLKIKKQFPVVVGLPWQVRKNFKPLIPHRPWQPFPIKPVDLCNSLGYEYILVTNLHELISLLGVLKPDYVLIAGAGLLPAEIVSCYKVINSHPGWLPLVRGLDALKWAIYEGLPIGVTTHIVNEEPDSGLLIRQVEVPLYGWDTFHSIAWRQYELEIELLSQAVEDIKKITHWHKLNNDHPVRRRMPHALETRLLQRLAERINRIENFDEADNFYASIQN
ncbi:MAG: formyltransferase family protein [Bacteroidia bacterium]|nr:formyl transferase [Bacteroidia bacterium]MDW8159560.1 formyltransferase family protein [Bacteroidia bacterium]